MKTPRKSYNRVHIWITANGYEPEITRHIPGHGMQKRDVVLDASERSHAK